MGDGYVKAAWSINIHAQPLWISLIFNLCIQEFSKSLLASSFLCSFESISYHFQRFGLGLDVTSRDPVIIYFLIMFDWYYSNNYFLQCFLFKKISKKYFFYFLKNTFKIYKQTCYLYYTLIFNYILLKKILN